MAATPTPKPDSSDPEWLDDDLGFEQFAVTDDDQSLSLDALSQAFAEMIGAEREPAHEAVANDQRRPSPADASEDDNATSESDSESDDVCPVTPRSILEAILFVGHPNNEPLTSKQLASLMRGVRPAEVNKLVRELNEQYLAEGCPYSIVSVGAGYRMQLREEFASLRDKFYGRIREARLSQSAVDVLAVVAYQQGITKKEVDSQRGTPSGTVLNQLVRRQLLRIERGEDKKRTAHYYTTDRFLHLFGLASVAELPRSQELDKSL